MRSVRLILPSPELAKPAAFGAATVVTVDEENQQVETLHDEVHYLIDHLAKGYGQPKVITNPDWKPGDPMINILIKNPDYDPTLTHKDDADALLSIGAEIDDHRRRWQAEPKSEAARAVAPLPYTLWINSWASDTADLSNRLDAMKPVLVNDGVLSQKVIDSAPAVAKPKSILDSSIVSGEHGLLNTLVYPALKIAAVAGVGYLGYLYVSKKIAEKSLHAAE